ncbi:MAG: tRNA uridine-5-carboxymethylaminomethyl(34) synthesis GTPase MnmE, partial [Candidatus Omnitrophota bacterium]
MVKVDLQDTIAAISTPLGEGGIGIVRLSGQGALSIADKMFVSRDGEKPSEYRTYTTHYGSVAENGEAIDEVLLTVMRSPKSYTKEDIVEINCHSGIVPLKRILGLALRLGARLAEPGEFTKRAFLNGRIDLTQAEAVLDIIWSKTKRGLDSALTHLSGRLSESIAGIKDDILDLKARIEASLDFSEEGLVEYDPEDFSGRLLSVRQKIKGLIDTSKEGRIVRDGITCVICGKPNVGKSSLMNTLLGEQRVIVTHIPGTTRDAIEEFVNIDGIPIRLVDTAGIAPTPDVLEREGMRRSRLCLDRADMVLFMMDAQTGISDADKEIIELIKGKEVIAVLNKTDLNAGSNITEALMEGLFSKSVSLVRISVLKETGLDSLKKTVCDMIWKGKVAPG